MSFENTIHGGAAPSMTTSVYYTGSDTLYEGYALCYDFNAADVNQQNETQTSPNVGEEVWADARRVLVEKPTEGNKIHFAGVVASNSDGHTGPCWVTIHRPGSVCNVYAASDIDHEEGAGKASGQIINVTVGSYAMTDGGMPGTGAAMVLQDVNRSSTNGVVMAELQVGPPSGGFVDVPGAAATGSISAVLSMIPVYCGTYSFSDGAAASAGVIISADMLAADGNWPGQKILFIGGASLVSTVVCLEPHSLIKLMMSTTAINITSAVVEISDTDEYATFEFDGVNWLFKGGHENLIS